MVTLEYFSFKNLGCLQIILFLSLSSPIIQKQHVLIEQNSVPFGHVQRPMPAKGLTRAGSWAGKCCTVRRKGAWKDVQGPGVAWHRQVPPHPTHLHLTVLQKRIPSKYRCVLLSDSKAPGAIFPKFQLKSYLQFPIAQARRS